MREGDDRKSKLRLTGDNLRRERKAREGKGGLPWKITPLREVVGGTLVKIVKK